MMITQSINLNLIPGGVLPRINVSQYDKGSRTLQFVLFNGPVLYSIESGTEITIQGSKPDNTAFQYDCTWSGSTVTMDIEQQMTAVAGDVICELVISNDGEILGTCNFILNVESAAVSDDTVISETELPLIERAVEAAVEAAASAASAAQSAEDAAQSAASIQTLTNQVKDMNNVLGAKNLLPFDLGIAKEINTAGTWSGNSYVYGGITFTAVLDDDGNLLYINVDGTSNINLNFNLCSNKNFRGLPSGSYIMSGCAAGGAYNKFRLRAQLCDGKESTTIISPDSDYGNGVSMTFESGGYLPGNYSIFIQIWGGQSFSNVKFYPMIRLASIVDDTYEPYAKTNQQLTQDKAEQAEVNDIVNVLGSKNFVDIEDFSLVKSNARTKSINKSDIRGEIPDKDVILSFTVSNSTLTVNGACFDVYDINNTRIGRTKFKEDGQYSVRFNGTNFRNLYIFISSEDIDSANCTISNIMIRLASITDDTFVPYAKTNQQLTQDTTALLDNLEVNGAVNILPNTATTQTIYGITFTVNDDGTVTANGTASGGNAAIVINQTDYLKKGNYTLSGAPSGYRISILRGASSTIVDDGDGADFSLTADATQALYVIAVVWEGRTVSNLTFKPMITVASYNGDYVPYAKSNRELTEELVLTKGAIAPATGVTTSGLLAEKYGKVVIINGFITIADLPGGLFTLGTIEGDFCPKTPVRANVGIAEHAYDIPTHFAYLIIETSGNIKLQTARTGASAVYFSLSYTTN